MKGCAEQCQLYPLSVGTLNFELQDRAYDLDWWQLCPDLALQVAVRNQETDRLTALVRPLPIALFQGIEEMLSLNFRLIVYREVGLIIWHLYEILGGCYSRYV